MSYTKLIDLVFDYNNQYIYNSGPNGVVYVDGGNYMTGNSIILDPTDGRPVYVMNNNENRPYFGIANDSETLNTNILPIYKLGTKDFYFSFELKLDTFHRNTYGNLFGIAYNNSDFRFGINVDSNGYKSFNFNNLGSVFPGINIDLSKIDVYGSFNKYEFYRIGNNGYGFINGKFYQEFSFSGFSFDNGATRAGWDWCLFARKKGNSGWPFRQIVGQAKSFKLYEGTFNPKSIINNFKLL